MLRATQFAMHRCDLGTQFMDLSAERATRSKKREQKKREAQALHQPRALQAPRQHAEILKRFIIDKLNKRLLQDEITRLTPRAQQLQTNIAQQIQQLRGNLEPGDMTIQLDQILMTEAIKLYPAEGKQDDRVCNNAGFKTAIQQMWNEYRQLRRPRVTTLANIWNTWRCYTRFQQLSKTLKSKAKQAKQENVRVVMQELEKAANAGDQYRVYQSAKKLAPWKPNTKVVIRGTDGQMLNHEEQLRALQGHAQQKFCKQQDYHPGSSLQHGIVIAEQELQQALATLPVRKAAPPGVAPSVVEALLCRHRQENQACPG